MYTKVLRIWILSDLQHFAGPPGSTSLVSDNRTPKITGTLKMNLFSENLQIPLKVTRGH